MHGLYTLIPKPSYACVIVMLELPYSSHVCNMYVLLTRCKGCEMMFSHIHFFLSIMSQSHELLVLATSSFHSVIITNNALRLVYASLLEHLVVPSASPSLIVSYNNFLLGIYKISTHLIFFYFCFHFLFSLHSHTFILMFLFNKNAIHFSIFLLKY